MSKAAGSSLDHNAVDKRHIFGSKGGISNGIESVGKIK